MGTVPREHVRDLKERAREQDACIPAGENESCTTYENWSTSKIELNLLYSFQNIVTLMLHMKVDRLERCRSNIPSQHTLPLSSSNENLQALHFKGGEPFGGNTSKSACWASSPSALGGLLLISKPRHDFHFILEIVEF
jgi:hypothetical protein